MVAQFWIATVIFVILGITPFVVSTVLNRQDARDRPDDFTRNEAAR